MAIVVQQGGGIVGGLGNIYRLTNYVYLQGQMGMDSVFYKLNTVTGAGGDFLGDILDNMYQTYHVALAAASATACTIVGAKLSPVWPLPNALPGIVTENVPGTGGVTPLPQQVSGIIKSVTSKSGPAYRGRYYVPFPWTAAMDADYTPTAAYTAKLDTLGGFLFNEIDVTPGATTYGFIPVIWHRAAGKSGMPAAHSFDPILDYSPDKAWATQKRRGDFGRLNANIIH